MRILSVLLCCALSASVGAAPFVPGARVAFVGDSITHHGQYLRYLNLFYATRFPGSGIRLFNCGINGDATGAVQMRLDEDVCALRPTDVSFMLGMNDANSERMAESYEPNFRKVVEIVRTGCPDVRFHWMLPTIYDATSAAGTTNNAVWRAERVNDVAVPAMRRLAKETDGRILDVNGDMRMWTARLQAENPKASLVSGDRCHPDRRGGFFIAWSYLRNQCVEPCLDRIVRDAGGKDALAFTLTEKALPYPIDPAAGDLAAKLPLDQICREELKVVNFAPGRYTLILDGQPVGTYSSEALARGVDLARNAATPQYRQALEVLKLVDARNEAEVHYRNLVWVWRMLKIRKVDFADAKAVRGYYESQPEKARKTGWLKYVPEWLEQWPRRADILADLERRMREIERAACPVARRWELRRASDDFALVRNGQSACVLVATGNKTVDADIAFFTNAVARISGAELVVVESGSCRKDVADSALPLQLGTTTNWIVFEIRKADLVHEDDYAIEFPDAETMKIVGTETSCRWALNALLEEAGVVFCMPGPHGTHWPQMRSLAFARRPRRATASLRLERDLFQEDLDWQRAMNGKKQKGRFFWHNLNAIFPIKIYGQEPWCSKIMPEQGGKRTCPKSWEARWQPCFASQEGIDEAVRRICEHLRRHPGEKVYSLAVNDLEGYCECAACRKLNGGFEKKSDYVTRFVDHSPSYYRWVNAVVRGVRKEFPDVVFGLLAYCGTIDPPPFALEPNIVPYLCFDIQQLSDPNARALRERLLAEWSKKCSALGIWDYAFGLPGYAVPREYPDEQGLYFGYKNGLCPKLEGFFTEGMISALVSEAKKRYLYYRLAWDSTRSAKDESDRWCRACVGEAAAPYLIAYYDLWKGFWHSEKLRQTGWYRDGANGVYFSYGSLEYLFALDEATRRRSAELMAAVVAAAERSGTPDQRKRASYLKHVEDYLSARQAASCLGYADEKGEFANAADAARYLRDLPKIEAAAAAVIAARTDIFADAKACPSPRVKERLTKFKEYAAGGNTSRLTNRALAYCAEDKTVDGLFRGLYPRAFDPAAKNLAILPDPAADAAAWELQKRGVAAKRVESADGTPRYALTTRDPKCYWQAVLKIVRDGIRPSTPYVCTARVTNPTKRPISVQLQAQTVAGDSLAPADLGQHNVVTVPPGESRTVAVFTVTHHRRDGVIRIGVIPHGLGADTVYVDNLRLVEVTSKREEAGDVILHDDFSGKNPVPWKIKASSFTYSDNEGVGGSRALVWECNEPTDAWHAVSCTFPCEVGRDYTCRIKVRDTKPIIGRAFVRIGCHGKDGKHPFVSVDGRPIVNNHWKGVREDFVEVTSCTPPVPSGAVTGFVEIAVRTMTTGRLVFDDFEVIRGGYTWIRYLQSGAYRDEAVGGEVKFAAFYDYDDAKCPLADRRAFFEYVDGGGKAKRVAAAELTETAFTGMLDVGDFAYGTNLVTAILTDVGGRELDRRQLPFAHLRELPKRRVTIDSHRRVVVDGKPFFPVGCYNCGKDEAKSDLYASAGFNCAISDKNDAIERMRKRGIKVIRISYAGDTNRIRSVVSRYAGDPNVIAWYTADELPLGFAKRQAAAIRCFHDLDPDRPAFTVLDRPKTARNLLESFDIIGSDPYPVSSAENRIGVAGECADLCVSATFGMRPLWQVCQAFDWYWHRRNFRAEMSEHHFPHPDEFANLVWQSVAAGATGIFWYDFDWWESYIPAEQRESSWACFKDTTAKLLKYSDVFLSVEPAPVAHVDAKGVRVRTWSLNGVKYLLVVNTDQEKSVKVRVTGLKAVRTSTEFGAVPQVKDGDLLLDLPKLGVAFATFECEFRGRVSGGGCPMKGVAVTDGLNVVTTDADGRFVLPRREGARFISVTVPSGWLAAQHYRVVAEGVPSYDFALEPWGASAPGRELRFVHIADSEITRIGAPEKRMFAHVKDVADREEAAFVIHTGDLWRGSGLKAHIELMNSGTMGRPMFYAIGNHDLSKEGAYGEWQFESLYGPSWYSFDAGGVHFCVTPVKKGDGIPSYTADNVAEWLKNDLAVVPKGRPVVIFNHSFWDCRLFDVSHIRDGTLRLGAFDVTAACNLTGLVFGHHHTNQFRRFGKIAVIQTSNPQMGGVDLSPANVRVVKVDGGGRLTSASHFSPCDVWPAVTQAEGGGWITKVPGPVYLGTPVTDGQLVFVGTLDDDGLGTGSVTALDPETGRIAWSAKTPNSIKNQLVVFEGLVIAQDGDGAVHAYDCRTGREAWVHDPENATLRPHQFGLALNAELGLVYCEIDLGFTALDARTGEVRWVCEGFKLWGSTASRPVCGEGIVTGEINWHGLYAFDAKTGRMVWRRDRFGELGSKETLRLRAGAVAIADGQVYATSDKGFRILDVKTGATVRERNFDFATTTTTTPLLFGGRVLIGSCGAGLVALDRETLDVVWKGPVGEALVVNGSYCQAPQHQVATAPVRVDETTVAAAAGDGTVRFWDVGSGRETRRVMTGAPNFSAPLVVGRKLVIADFAGYVRAMSLDSGEM